MDDFVRRLAAALDEFQTAVADEAANRAAFQATRHDAELVEDARARVVQAAIEGIEQAKDAAFIARGMG